MRASSQMGFDSLYFFIESPTVCALSHTVTQTPPLTPTPEGESGSVAALALVFLYAVGIYAIATAVVAAPIGLVVMWRYGTYGWVKDSLVLTATGFGVYVIVTLATFPPTTGGLLLLWILGFVPTGLVLFLVGTLGHWWFY